MDKAGAMLGLSPIVAKNMTPEQAEARKLANFVEIDLVLQGQRLIEYPNYVPTWDYSVTVMRVTHPERYEIYSATLPKRLPRFRVPMASDDRDTVLDLQAAVSQAYDQENSANR